jgi:hypothetical protein
MADVRVAQEFFETNLPANLLECVDLSSLSLEKESFIDEHFKATEADLIYSVKVEVAGTCARRYNTSLGGNNGLNCFQDIKNTRRTISHTVNYDINNDKEKDDFVLDKDGRIRIIKILDKELQNYENGKFKDVIQNMEKEYSNVMRLTK